MVGRLRWIAALLLLISIIVGTSLDKPHENPRLMLGGYYVLAADFHIHTFPLSWAALSPWDTVVEARRHALDVIAITPHNHTWVARMTKWFYRSSYDPIVIDGEEIHSTDYHLLAIGIRNTIDWRQPAGSALDEVHKQGGFAIAAHPTHSYSGYDKEAMGKLDGAEVVHPLGLKNETLAAQLREFFNRTPLTAIGDSDYHFGPMSPNLGEIGVCRTYVFARQRSEQSVFEALRERRTVVYDRGQVFGDPAMIQLAAVDGRLPNLALAKREQTFSSLAGGITGVIGLLSGALCVLGGRRHSDFKAWVGSRDDAARAGR